MFGRFMSKKAAAAKQSMAKVENRDLMQAIIGGCLLVAAADGEIEKSEIEKIDRLIQANESLSHFGSEITATLSRFTAQLEAGFLIGRMKILREIRDVANDPEQAEEVFLNMLTVAQADGEVEAEEVKVLVEVAKELGLRAADYGVEV